MTDQTAEPAADSLPADTAATAPAPPARRRGWLMPTLVVLVVGAAGAGLLAWLQRERAALVAAAGVERAALEGRITTLARSIDTLAEEYRGVAEARIGQEARLAELADGLSRLYARIDQSDPDWVLAEIEYLLIAAAQRLHIEGDVGTAIAALDAADGRIRDLGDPAFLVLRERLAGDLAALRAVPVPDLAGVATELAAWTARVDALPLRRVDFTQVPSADEPPPTTGWRAVPERMWNDLVDLIDVERIEIPDALLTDPEGRRRLTDTLRLELSAARLAVLRRDEDNLRAAAGIVRELLSTYFAAADPAVAAVHEGLGRIAGLTLRPPLPSLDASLEAVRRLRAGDAVAPAAKAEAPRVPGMPAPDAAGSGADGDPIDVEAAPTGVPAPGNAEAAAQDAASPAAPAAGEIASPPSVPQPATDPPAGPG